VAHRLYRRVAARANHLCEYCLAPEEIFNQEFEVDHIVPLSRGGSDYLDNLALACRSCNLRKGQHGAARDPVSKQVVPLFHPRQDRWDGHFSLNIETFMIEGTTPIGRATVARLGLNRRKVVRARALWLAVASMRHPGDT